MSYNYHVFYLGLRIHLVSYSGSLVSFVITTAQFHSTKSEPWSQSSFWEGLLFLIIWNLSLARLPA